MKIAIYHNLPGGGAKRALYEQVRCLVTSAEVDLYILSTNTESFLDLRSIVKNTFVYPFFQLHRRRFWPAVIWLSFWIERLAFTHVAKGIARDIDKRGYDFVYIHQCEFSHIPIVTRYLRTPTIVYCQEPWRKMYEPTLYLSSIIGDRGNESPIIRITRWLERLQWPLMMAAKHHDRKNAQEATMILANSYYSKEYIHKAYRLMAEVDYLGVDLQKFHPSDKTRTSPFVLAVGALSSVKGYDFIIRSLGRIPQRRRPALVIVADRTSGSSVEHYLRSIAKKLGVQLNLRAAISDKELVQLYNGAVVLVYAPIMEPFGLAALEAMACGTPVVGVREGGLREAVIDGVNGFLTERDEVSFSAAIERVVTDPELRSQLSHHCRPSVEQRFSWRQSVNRLLELSQRLNDADRT